jgi:hypothetical protein
MSPSRTDPPRTGEDSGLNFRETLSHLEDLLEEFHAMLPAGERCGESADEPEGELTEQEFRLAFGEWELAGELVEEDPARGNESVDAAPDGAVSASELGMLLDEELLNNLVFSEAPEPAAQIGTSGGENEVDPLPTGQTEIGDSPRPGAVEAPAFLLEPPILSGTTRLVEGPGPRGPRRWLITACEALIARAGQH